MSHLVKWVQLKKFEELTGYTPMAVYKKIDKGQWPEGASWRRAPDGHILVNLEWYEQWAEGRAAPFVAGTPTNSFQGRSRRGSTPAALARSV